MMNRETVLLVTIMRNEGPYILEWVAHHLSVGVDEFLIFTNDCDDGTDAILSRLGRFHRVTQVPNPKVMFRDKGNWQVMALRYAQQFGDYRTADWIYHTDADEFLHIRAGDGTLEDFYKAAADKSGDFHAVSFSSMPFSSGGEKALDDQLVQSRYTQMSKSYGASREAGTPVLNAVKTMFRNDVDYDLRRNHRPYMAGFSAQGLTWVDGSGRRLGPDYTDSRIKVLDAVGSTDLAQMSHYAIKCAEAYMVMLDRGDAVTEDRLGKQSNYWKNYNTQGDEEPAFATLSPKAQALLDGFLADPELARLHREALEVHKAKVAAMREKPEWQAVASHIGLE